MEKSDTLKILTILEISYPNWIAKMDMSKKRDMVALWTELLSEDDYTSIANAVKAIVQTDVTGYAPSIGQIRAKAYELTHRPGMSEVEAWGYVAKALRNSIHNSIAEHAKLPEEVKSAVTPDQLKEWSQVDSDQVSTVIASNFQRSFRGRSKSYKENELLPEGFRIRLAEVKENMRIEMNDRGDNASSNRIDVLPEETKIDKELSEERKQEIIAKMQSLGNQER